MEELFSLADFLRRFGGLIGDFVGEDVLDLGEGGVEVDCKSVEIVDVGGEAPPRGLWGLDSHSRVMRLEGVDVRFSSGALIGPKAVLIPGVPNAKWIALRFRFRADEDALAELGELSKRFYVKSRFIDRIFDGSFNEVALQDEVRVYVEDELMRAGDWDGVLLIDGPIFLTPKVLSMSDNAYSALYLGLIRDRVSAIGGRRAIGVTKRISNSRYLSSCPFGGVDVDDDTLARKMARGFGDAVAIGPVRIAAGGFEKFCWYLVVRLGRMTHVVRIEGLDEDLAREAVEWMPKVVGPGGVPTPIQIADRLARRMSAAAYSLFWRMSPLGITYEGVEELERAVAELGGW